jgi:hypothetical protein
MVFTASATLTAARWLEINLSHPTLLCQLTFANCLEMIKLFGKTVGFIPFYRDRQKPPFDLIPNLIGTHRFVWSKEGNPFGHHKEVFA